MKNFEFSIFGIVKRIFIFDLIDCREIHAINLTNQMNMNEHFNKCLDVRINGLR